MKGKGKEAGDTARDSVAHAALLPLTPNYVTSDHETYVNAIETALKESGDSAIRNIALTGSYGVGKSSILQEVADRHDDKAVQVSLSTLGFSDLSKPDPASGAPITTTNLIQKEIVKQLLYREDPAKMPGSRFRRIGRFKFWRQAFEATLVGLVITLVFFLAGWTQRLVVLVPSDIKLGGYAHAAVFIAATAFALALEWLFHNRIRIEKLSAGAATIALSGESGTYFDEYLDEIVYFFDITGRDLVIFEDIDRFDDPHIFETLRALNALLNRAGQLKGRKIRFIYAIKDSIFDKLGVRAAAEEGDSDSPERVDTVDCEMARANRTKFFDLVIPVVPFITHRNARDLMDRVMKQSGSTISSELIDLSAQHLVDMRLIKNVHNEFVIFRSKVLDGEGGGLGLSEDALFAMMLYKSTHLKDFENIKIGESRLDVLYEDYRQLVAENMSGLASDEVNVRRRVASLDSAESRSAAVGQGLLDYIDRLQRQLSANKTEFKYANASINADHLKTKEFWEGFLAGDQPVVVNIWQPNNHIAAFSLTRAELELALGKSLSPKDWEKSDRAQLRERLQKIGQDREFLRSAGMRDLFDREEFKLTKVDAGQFSFRELVAVHLDSNLARQLVAAGYIDRNFTLYTSTYYANRVSSQAMNFMIHNIDPNLMDPHFELSSADVRAVFRERGESVLRQRGMYNINVLDHLLEKKDTRVEALVRSLMIDGEDERVFLASYFAGGDQLETLVRKLAERWTAIFRFILNDAQLGDEVQARLVNVALGSIVNELEYESDETVREYFEGHYAELQVLTSEDTTAGRAAIVAKLLAAADVRIAELSGVAPEVRYAMVASNRYIISRDNLVLALGEPASLALDTIKTAYKVVYAHVMDSLPSYLEALVEDEPSVSIDTADDFGAILSDVAGHDESQLARMIALAAPDCVIQDLEEVPQVAWPFLAGGNRFPATFANVFAYVAQDERLDEHLAGLLRAAESIAVAEDTEESHKTTLAKHILDAKDVLPDPAIRTQLVVSLGLDDRLPGDAVPKESGQLIGMLVEAEVVADDEDTFELAAGMDWATREYLISKSRDFVSYMTPAQVPVDDVAPLIRSAIIPEAVKATLFSRSAEFTGGADRTTLTVLAQFALDRNARVPVTELNRWALARIEAQLVVRLLVNLLPGISEAELTQLLGSIGGDYAAVSARNGKRPKLANTHENLALIERLEQLGIVSSFEVVVNKLRVNMKRA